MNLRVSFALTVTVLLLLIVGCSQEQITNPGLTDNDLGVTEVRPPEENLSELGKATGAIAPGRYIVQFNGDVTNVRDSALRLANKYGFAIASVYEHTIKGFPVKITEEIAGNLRLESGVLTVVPDQWAHTVAQGLPTGVDRIDTELSPIAAIDGVPTSIDIDIAILDTGIDPSHPDLTVVDGIKFSGGLILPNYEDDNGHGTHVAGTAAAIDDTSGVVGVAPGARLWAVKVLDSTGSGLVSDIILGLDWVAARAGQIEIANLSLSSIGWSTPLNDAVQGCVDAGVLVVAAAGNEGIDVFGADGTIGTADDIVPAACPAAATISAFVDTDGLPGGLGAATIYGPDDSFADFSNYSASVFPGNPVTSPGAAIDLILPGVDIVSTIPGGGFFSSSGTSMAAPHAAGLYALAMTLAGSPVDATGVYAIRQLMIDLGVDQNSGPGLDVLNDPDGNLERLGFAVEPVLAADIGIAAFTGPATVLPGEALVMNVTLANFGNQAATPFDAYIGVQGTTIELTRRTLPGLDAFDALSGQVTFIVPAKDLQAAVDPGVYTIFCSHDFVDGVPENDMMSFDVELLALPDFGTVVINPDPDALNAPWTLDGPGTPQNGTGDLTLTELPLGDYTLTWGAVAGWNTPAAETLTLVKDATITFNGVYTEIPTTGNVVVNPDPDALNASWTLVVPDKATFTGAGDSTLVDVPVGDVTVTWDPVAGYITPVPETLALAGGATITFNGLYQEESATGTVAIDAEPDALNAPWSVSGPGGVNTGTGDISVPGFPVGDYTITWGAVAGWTAPAAETLTLTQDATITFLGVYTEVSTTGTVVIDVDPDLGFPWTVTGPDTTVYTGMGDDTLLDVPAGEYSIDFGPFLGWDAPEGDTQTLAAGGTITFAGTYTPSPGDIIINADPDIINAPWTLDGPDAFTQSGNGDLTINGLADGIYTITWEDVALYETPAPETNVLPNGGSLTFTGVYTAIPVGTVSVNPDPNLINAPWELDGPDGLQTGNGDVNLLNQLAGDYTITWLDVAGYITPAGETQTLTGGGVVTFAATYEEEGTGEFIGIWFDVDATQTCAEAGFATQVPAYIVYSDPSVTQIRGFEGGIDLTRSLGETFTSFYTINYPVQTIDVGTNDLVAGTYNFIAGYSEALPTTTNTVICNLSLFLLDFDDIDSDFREAIPATIPGSPSVLMDDFNPLAVPVGGGTITVTGVGGCAAKLAAQDSYGQVQNLFK